MKDKKPAGYWKSLDNTLAETQRVMDENGFRELPGSTRLEKLGENSLAIAIKSYHDGFSSFRRKLNQKQKRLPSEKVRDFSFILSKAREIVAEHGELLPQRKLVKLGYSSFAHAVMRYHGGFPRLRKVLGDELKTKKYENEDEMIACVHEIMGIHRWKNLPGQSTLEKHGYSRIVAAISRYYGGLPSFREKLGLESLSVPNGAWKDENFTVKQALSIMDEHGFKELPSGRELARLGYVGFVTGVGRYHGGIDEFKGILAERLGKTPEKYRLEELVDEYIEGGENE